MRKALTGLPAALESSWNVFSYTRRTDGRIILKRMAFFLGKFIYIMDAFDDVEKDIKSGSYNALKRRFGHENFTEECNFMLNMMMAECTIEFEKLPCIQDVEILRNILYAGVWKKFDKKAEAKEGSIE